MAGPTDTTRYPDVAPAGIVIVIELALQELIVAATAFIRAWLLPCDAPNPDPEITIWLPTEAVVAETPVITGAGLDGVLIDTLSNVAVYVVDVLWLVTPRPMYTF